MMKRSLRAVLVVFAAMAALDATACIPQPSPPPPDTTAPVLSLPADVTTAAQSPAGATVTWTATATDNKDGTVPVICTPASGSVFAVGTTTVICTATDAAANTANGSFSVTVTGLTGAVAISAGGAHTCALLADGTAKCWGDNSAGQLGTATATGSSTVTVTGLTGAVAISAGGAHTCALLAGGTVKCWGDNFHGQLGNGTATPVFPPVPAPNPVTVTGLTTAVAITAGDQHTCALLADGTVKCWGWSYEGRLGDGTSDPWTPTTTPVTVTGLTSAVAISTDSDAHTCAVLADGTAKCWGNNSGQQLGDGSNVAYSTTPVTVSGLTDAVATSASSLDHRTCALRGGGTVKCWGYGGSGGLGDGTFTSSPTPVTVTGLTGAVAVTNGSYANGLGHSCALLNDGTAKCWGYNETGVLGNGQSGGGEWSNTPVTVSGLAGAAAITAGDHHTCALLDNGTAMCWGSDQYGGGDSTDFFMMPTPVAVPGLP